MHNISDKLIDSQGNVGTYSSGSDARLFYVDGEGETKKYLLDGEVPSGGGSTTYITSETFPESLDSNTKIQVLEPVSSLNMTFDPTTNGAEIIFSTSDQVTNNLVIPCGMFYITKLSTIQGGKSYKIIVDNNTVELLALKKVVPYSLPSGQVGFIESVDFPSDVFFSEIQDFVTSAGMTVTCVWDHTGQIIEGEDLYQPYGGWVGDVFLGIEMAGAASAMGIVIKGDYDDSGEFWGPLTSINDINGWNGERVAGLAFSWNSDVFKEYVLPKNEELQQESNDDTASEITAGFNAPMVGKYAKNIRIWNRVLTSEEIESVLAHDMNELA